MVLLSAVGLPHMSAEVSPSEKSVRSLDPATAPYRCAYIDGGDPGTKEAKVLELYHPRCSSTLFRKAQGSPPITASIFQYIHTIYSGHHARRGIINMHRVVRASSRTAVQRGNFHGKDAE
jgi:hypothetical protein